MCCVNCVRKRRISDAVRPAAMLTRRCSVSDSNSNDRPRRRKLPKDANPRQKPSSARPVRNASPSAMHVAAVCEVMGSAQERSGGNTRRKKQWPSRKQESVAACWREDYPHGSFRAHHAPNRVTAKVCPSTRTLFPARLCVARKRYTPLRGVLLRSKDSQSSPLPFTKIAEVFCG